jgi:PAS domain S-box-containing protein
VTLVSAVAAQLGAIIQRKHIEQQFRRSEAQLRAIVDAAADAIITIDGEGVVHSFNRGAEHTFGYTQDEIIGQPLVLLMPQRLRERHMSGLRRYLHTGVAQILGRPLEVMGLHKNGTEVPLELTVSEVRVEDTLLFSAILRDITERKKLDAERAALLAVEQEHSKRLRELATLKADFTTMVAHELGAPLAAIRALADMLATGDINPDTAAQVLAAIQSEAAVLTALVADVQTAASVERDDFMIQVQPTPLLLLLNNATAFACTLPGNHPLTLHLDRNVTVLADPERIGQVLRNLVSNAAKYTPDGTPIAVRAVLQGMHVRVEVVDTGPGIEQRDMHHIFEKFGRGRDQLGRAVPGIGVGLYLSRRIVRAHGFDLTVTSTPGRGSTFGFELEVVA